MNSDDFDSVTKNLRNSAKGSLVTYDDIFPPTLRVREETRDRTCQNTTRTAPGVRGQHELLVSRINGVGQQDSAGNTTDDAEWMRNDAALFLMG